MLTAAHRSCSREHSRGSSKADDWADSRKTVGLSPKRCKAAPQVHCDAVFSIGTYFPVGTELPFPRQVAHHPSVRQLRCEWIKALNRFSHSNAWIDAGRHAQGAQDLFAAI